MCGVPTTAYPRQRRVVTSNDPAAGARGGRVRSFDWRRRSRELWRDLWPVLVIAIPGLLGTGSAGDDEVGWSRTPDLFAHVLVVFAALSAAMWRQRPDLTALCCAAAVVTYLAAGYPVGPILVAVPLAVGGLAAASPLRRTLAWSGGFALATCVAGSVRFGSDLAGSDAAPLRDWLLTALALVAVPAVVGAAVRARRDAEAGVREAQARRAVSEERLRMAHELHDAVGHGLAVIAMQAGVALHVLERDPPKARESLEAIQATSRESLHGMRQQLDVWRGPQDEGEHLRPGPGMADAALLLRRIRGGGLEIAAELPTGQLPLPPEVDIAAYRILQESLTNVLRHAGATRAQVRVTREGDDLVMEVTDNGSAGDTGTAPHADGRRGSGIAGMRARVEALGGDLSAGRRPEGGFVVRARLPLLGRSGPVDLSES